MHDDIMGQIHKQQEEEQENVEMKEDTQAYEHSSQENVKRTRDKSTTPEGIETIKKTRVRESRGLEFKHNVKRK